MPRCSLTDATTTARPVRLHTPVERAELLPWRRCRGEHLGRCASGELEAVPRVTYTEQAGVVGAVEAKHSATAPVSEAPKTATYTRVRRLQRVLDPAQRRGATDRRLRVRAGGG